MVSPPPMLDPNGPPPGAGWLNRLVEFLESCGISVDADSGLVGSKGWNGTSIGIQDTPDLYARITSVGPSGSYSWREIIPAASGGWADGPRVGYYTADTARGSVAADPAWEANANASLAIGYRIELSRDPAVGRLTFTARKCS
jgi:hypothetical protein